MQALPYGKRTCLQIILGEVKDRLPPENMLINGDAIELISKLGARIRHFRLHGMARTTSLINA